MTKIDRRGFLRTGVKVGGAAMLGSSVVGASAAPLRWLEGAPAQGHNAPEVVVVGAGAFGGWTALYLQDLGFSTTLVDQWGPGNLWSSSGGHTRGMRFGYGEREMYTRWAYHALGLWKRWSGEWGPAAADIFTQSGRLLMRPNEVRSSKAALDKHGVPNEILSQDELAYRYPQINSESIEEALFEPEAGILRCGRACELVATAFKQKGGQFVIGRAAPGRVENGRLQDIVLHNGDRITAQMFVFACGPWLPKALPEAMEGRLRTGANRMLYVGTPPDDHRFMHWNLPSFGVPETYGFPALEAGNHGFKIGAGGGGGPQPQDPYTSDRRVPEENIRTARATIAKWFPALKDQPILLLGAHHSDASVDGHFIIDQHPEMENTWIAGGGSGHGFKHGPAVGEYTANRITGNDIDPGMAEYFRLKPQTFSAREAAEAEMLPG